MLAIDESLDAVQRRRGEIGAVTLLGRLGDAEMTEDPAAAEVALGVGDLVEEARAHGRGEIQTEGLLPGRRRAEPLRRAQHGGGAAREALDAEESGTSPK